MEQDTNFHTVAQLTVGAPTFDPQERPDYYEMLDVPPTATRLELREAYLRLKSAYGFGSAAIYSLMSEDDAKVQLALVEEAHRILSDDVERRAYDLSMGFGESSPRMREEWPTEGSLLGESVPADYGTERILRSREQSLQIASSLSGSLEASPRLSPSLGSPLDAIDTRWDGTVMGLPEPADLISEPMTVRTTRSNLSIVRLKASQEGLDKLGSAMQALLESYSAGDGELFRKLREAAGVSPEEMQERIKVSIGYIQAIESNQMEKLPQAVYVKGFLRSYFRYLAVPGFETLVTAFAERLEECQAQRKM